jgi:ATP adenylyltransferase/5',5'''-P-1,P-4-tetraphosphate phosphorylase II
MHGLETDTNVLKESIICLKNDVLYGYTDRKSAADKFKLMEEQLLEINKQMEEYLEKLEPADLMAKRDMLEGEYTENMILYRNKLKIAGTRIYKEKYKLVKEAVHISQYLTNLAKQIREIKKTIETNNKDN